MYDPWPQALLFIAGSLRAGLSLEEAIGLLIDEAPAPLKSLLTKRLPAEARWLPLPERVAAIFKEEELGLARAALLLAHRTGGNIAPVLERCAQTLQTKKDLTERMEALTAQARFSAWIIGLAPFLLMVGFVFFSPDYIEPLFQTPQGRRLLVAAICMVATGLFIVRRLVRVES